MPRLPRVYIENILYYITSKGGHSQSIFIAPADYLEYISLIDKYKTQYGFKLFSFALLPNHLHMLIELKNSVGISNIMHDINSLYTKNFNSKYNKRGHLFQERFKTVMAEKETHLLGLGRHIHLHPKRANLVYSPEEYPYSSYCKYLDPEKSEKPDMKDEIEEVFEALKGREDSYKAYVNRQDPNEAQEFRKHIRKKRILGSDAFEERIKKTIEETARQKKFMPLRKARIIYMFVSALTILAFVITMVLYKERASRMKSSFDKTLKIYEDTLEVLKHDRDIALRANEDTEKYMWKIELAEEALEELRREKAEAIRLEKEIDGYAWRVTFRQIRGPRMRFAASDTIFFDNNRMNSDNLGDTGFPASNYTKRELKNGKVVWETMQTGPRGQTASWRGEWDGTSMEGVLSIKSVGGAVRDFSFISTGERSKSKYDERG